MDEHSSGGTRIVTAVDGRELGVCMWGDAEARPSSVSPSRMSGTSNHRVTPLRHRFRVAGARPRISRELAHPGPPWLRDSPGWDFPGRHDRATSVRSRGLAGSVVPQQEVSIGVAAGFRVGGVTNLMRGDGVLELDGLRQGLEALRRRRVVGHVRSLAPRVRPTTSVHRSQFRSGSRPQSGVCVQSSHAVSCCMREASSRTAQCSTPLPLTTRTTCICW